MFFILYGQKSEQANKEHINPAGNTRVFHALHIFHIFTSENVENTSVLAYGKTPITI